MEFIGEYHRDKVLSLPKKQRKQMDLPPFRDDVKIVNELFGWVLQRGKEKIECRSEDEARYIYALWSFNWTDFWVPKDDKYLAEILPRLLALKKGHDEIIEKKCNLYFRKSIREELRRRIYLTVTLRDDNYDYNQDYGEDVKSKNEDLKKEEIEKEE
jgi:hypothetical protein